jgi:ABC-type amino acid transport substrate-binding protein
MNLDFNSSYLRLISSLILFVTLLTVGKSVKASEPFIIGIPENAPISIIEGDKPKGLMGDLIATVFNNMGLEYKAISVPFARMYKWVETGKIDLALSVLETPERQKKAYYSVPVLAEYNLILSKNGQTLDANNATGLKSIRLGGILGFTYPALENANIPILRERSHLVNLKKMTRGSLDGIIIGSIVGPYWVKKAGMQERVAYSSHAINKIDLRIALSKSRFSKEDLNKINQNILLVLASSQWKKIAFNNGFTGTGKTWPIASYKIEEN